MGELAGTSTIVTGGASGIGAEICRTFAGEDARVVVADLDREGGEAVVDSIVESGGEALFVPVDVTDADAVKSVAQTALDEFGGLDVLVNNAGIEGHMKKIEDYEEEEYDRVMDVNAKGVWLGAKYAAPEMADRGGGSIVNTASIAAEVGFPTQSPYCASKAAVLGITRAVAKEYADDQVRVNAVEPGLVNTPMLQRFMEGTGTSEETVDSMEELPGHSEPADIADGVLYLASDRSRRVTGSVLRVDGGFLA